MNCSNKRKFVGLILALVFCLISLSSPIQTWASFPYEMRMFSGQGTEFNLQMPVQAQVNVDHPEVVRVNGNASHSFNMDLSQPFSLQSAQAGTAEMQLKLFGRIPFKTLKVNVMPDLKVIPGGQTIGVKLQSDGVLVVGHHQVQTTAGKYSPGEKAEIKRGDLITHLNGQKLQGMKQVADIVNQAGERKQTLNIRLERHDKVIESQLVPALDEAEQQYRMGLYIRDSAAGVGTLTFYAPEQGVYGALGHMISDMDTQTKIKVGSGQIIHSKVTSISKSKDGTPGEKRAHFFNSGQILGDIQRNSDFGIFGKMKQNPDFGKIKEAIPVAFSEEIIEGPAQILTVVEGQKVETFDIEVVNVARQTRPQTKGLVIRVTDKRLLDKTGGIVQGMSGSPIIQNGKIIGAVTHVFVNDPSSGYGCFIEWMLQESGIVINGQSKPKDAA